MPTPKQTITLDVNRRDASPPRVFLGGGDRNGTLLRVNVTEDGRPFDCTGMTPYLVTPVCRWQGTASGPMLEIPVDESMLGDYSGTTGGAYVSLESEDMATSTQRFVVTVYPRVPEPEEPEDPEEPQDPEGPTGLGMAPGPNE